MCNQGNNPESYVSRSTLESAASETPAYNKGSYEHSPEIEDYPERLARVLEVANSCRLAATGAINLQS